MRTAQTIAACVFLLSAALQWNDPDPLPWIVIYSLAATSCLLVTRNSACRTFALAIALGSALWAATLAPQVLGAVSFSAMFQDMQMKNTAVEQGRETGGLLMISLWVMISLIVVRKPTH